MKVYPIRLKISSKLGQYQPDRKTVKNVENLSAEIGKAKQAYGPMVPGFPKLWAISKKYGPLQ